MDIQSDPSYNMAEQPVYPPILEYDPEWLAITRAFHPWLSTTKYQPAFPDEAEARALVAKELEWVKANVKTNEKGQILVSEHQSFVMTAPGPGSEGANKTRQRKSSEFWCQKIFRDIIPIAPWYTNPQTESFCRMLDIPNKINPPPTNPTGSSSNAGASSLADVGA